MPYQVILGKKSDGDLLEFKEIGKELFDDGGVDAMENFFFAVDNRIQGEIEQSPKNYRSLWNGISDEWNYP